MREGLIEKQIFARMGTVFLKQFQEDKIGSLYQLALSSCSKELRTWGNTSINPMVDAVFHPIHSSQFFSLSLCSLVPSKDPYRCD